ncbi:hypothetical protein [Nostoc sp.]
MLPDAYFSGHFDGEGCIRMSRHHKGWRLIIAVKIAHKVTIDLYQERFGGSVRPQPKASTNKLLWEWYLIDQSKCLHFIESILPCSMEKREQLVIGKKWLELRMAGNLRHPSDELRVFGESYSIKLVALKKI